MCNLGKVYVLCILHYMATGCRVRGEKERVLVQNIITHLNVPILIKAEE